MTRIFLALTIWVGVAFLALPQGHTFVDRLISFGWFLIGIGAVIAISNRSTK